MELRKSEVNFTLMIAIAVITFLLTSVFFVGLFFMSDSILNPFSGGDAATKDEIAKFQSVKNIIKDKYFLETNEEDMLEGAIAGMAYSLGDPYTVYYSKERMAQFNEKSKGSYVGIGVSIKTDKDGILNIIETFDGSPAKKEGILKDDKIIKVDDEDVTVIKDDAIIINMIKGVEDTNVKITVYRPSDEKSIDFTITRKKIKITNVKSKVLENNLGYINIRMFDGETYDYFEQHLKELIEKGVKGLIIDVRDNPGGSYSQVVHIADRLLPEALIVYTQDKRGDKIVENSDSIELDMPIVVLINENSASASEVLAGALSDNDKAKLVGTTSFGKGLVQTVYTLGDQSGIKITTARYYTPDGVCIHKKGIEPDIKVEIPEEYKNLPVSQIPENEDSQLNKAIEVIKNSLAK